MRTVWKYSLPGPGYILPISIPANARVLAVQPQQGAPTLWVQVDTNCPTVIRQLLCIGTGHDLPEGPWEYLGTVQDGSMVWHYYWGW